jgi:hypothetical protein
VDERIDGRVSDRAACERQTLGLGQDFDAGESGVGDGRLL